LDELIICIVYVFVLGVDVSFVIRGLRPCLKVHAMDFPVFDIRINRGFSKKKKMCGTSSQHTNIAVLAPRVPHEVCLLSYSKTQSN